MNKTDVAIQEMYKALKERSHEPTDDTHNEIISHVNRMMRLEAGHAFAMFCLYFNEDIKRLDLK